MSYISSVTLPDGSNYKIKDTNAKNENLAINPDFKINQRGQSEYSSIGYTVDRWKASAKSKISVQDNGIKVGYSSASEQAAAVSQSLENYAEYAGKQITLSASINVISAVKATLYIVYVLDGELHYTYQFCTTAGVHFITANIPDNITRLEIMLYGADQRQGDDEAAYSIFEWAQLELGSVATPFVPPNPATELLKCQRYYQVRTTGDIDPVDLRPNMRTITDIKERSDGYYEYIAEL